jgi:hypothetical protein
LSGNGSEGAAWRTPGFTRDFCKPQVQIYREIRERDSVKPLDCSLRHAERSLSCYVSNQALRNHRWFVEILGEGRQSGAVIAAWPSRSAENSINDYVSLPVQSTSPNSIYEEWTERRRGTVLENSEKARRSARQKANEICRNSGGTQEVATLFTPARMGPTASVVSPARQVLGLFGEGFHLLALLPTCLCGALHVALQ